MLTSTHRFFPYLGEFFSFSGLQQSSPEGKKLGCKAHKQATTHMQQPIKTESEITPARMHNTGKSHIAQLTHR
jgi:hypothetical protein